MGLFGFGKKKSLDQPTAPQTNNPALSLNADLPSIDGSTLPGNNSTIPAAMPADMNAPAGMPQLPPLEALPANDSNSISISVPTLDFSLPPSDEEAAKPAAAVQDPVTEPAELIAQPPAPEQVPEPIDAEDLNRLFITDDWKEPDLNNFDPYNEEKIEEPISDDFKGAQLPEFDDAPIVEPQPPAPKPAIESRPVQLFIRGRAYSRVFNELDQMSSSLASMNSKSNTYEDVLRREDQLLSVAKDQMEYLYKRINIIDKKIFVQ